MAIMKATHIISLLKMNLAGSNPALFFLMMFIRGPSIQRAAGFITKSVFFKYFDWRSQEGKWRVRFILSFFAFLAFAIFLIFMNVDTYNHIILMESLLFSMSITWIGFMSFLVIGLFKLAADKVLYVPPAPVFIFQTSKLNIDYYFKSLLQKPEIRPPLQNSDC